MIGKSGGGILTLKRFRTARDLAAARAATGLPLKRRSNGAGYTTDRVTVITVVVVGRVGFAIHIEVGVVGIVATSHDGRPEVSVRADVSKRAVPTAGRSKP